MKELRSLPQVDALARLPELASFSEVVRVSAARRAVDHLRDRLTAGKDAPDAVALAVAYAQEMAEPRVRPAINATGVVLHTGLGRARLAPEAAQAVSSVAAAHCTLEIDLKDGKRGDRQAAVRDLLLHLSGAEDALVVNNGAAAVYLALAALAQRKEVLLSRGQMVEIGGSFRVPDIVRASGCRLVEVGCTNKTRLSDFEGGLSARTAAVLRCHPSNFKMVGFVDEPSAESLAEWCRVKGLALIDDVGSGCVFDLAALGLPSERTLREAVQAGATLVTASGDKLLGGPQAGLIVGSREAVQRCRKHPMARVLRIDKLSLAALEATLKLARDGDPARLPALWSAMRPLDGVKQDAQALLAAAGAGAILEEGITEIGGGSTPGEGVETWRVGLAPRSAERTLAALRSWDPPIFARIENGRVWLDPRTLSPDELATVQEALRSCAESR